MDKSEFKNLQEGYLHKFNEYAQKRFSGNFNTEETLLQSMKYSFFVGGKRLRPTMMLAAANLYGVTDDRVLPFAFALECIHTYSLIHDDLPAMDNDDYRRGNLTNHKVFGEAVAILAGDALLNFAFSVIAQECVNFPDPTTCECFKALADFAGFEGMIGGQSADVFTEKNNVKDENILVYIEENKTAKLLTLPFLIPCILAGADKERALNIGKKIGVQFQIVDDVLDVESSLSVLGKSVGKDAAEGKLTYVTLYGLDAAKARVSELYEECLAILSEMPGNDYFKYLCIELKERVF